MIGSTRQHSVSCASYESIHRMQCFSRGKPCISLGKRWCSRKTPLSNALRRASTLPRNEKRIRTAGRMGEVGPPAARLSLFTDLYSHLAALNGHPALRGQAAAAAEVLRHEGARLHNEMSGRSWPGCKNSGWHDNGNAPGHSPEGQPLRHSTTFAAKFLKGLYMRFKKVISAVAVALAVSSPTYAGVPVVDGINLPQNIMAAIEAVAQTLKQIEQYSTQLQQYENQLQNTVAPAAYIWDQAQTTINNLQRATDTLNYYKTQLGSLDNYLAKFQDVSYYRSAACFSRDGCTAAQRAALDANAATSSQALKKAHDAMFQGIDQQQQNLNNGAAQLQRLQSQAQGASGQMQAIGFANQLASNQANQLLQIRALLIAQQNALATRANADADKEAQQAAARATSAEARIDRTSSPINWLSLTR